MTLARYGTGENLMMSHEADLYWAGVIGATVAYDAWALRTDHETASSGMRRYTEAPWQKFMLCGVLGGLALHWLSESLDPGNLVFRHNADASGIPDGLI